MAAVGPKLPAREVLRFGLGLFARIALGTGLGVVVIWLVQLLAPQILGGSDPAADAKALGWGAMLGFIGLSFLVRPLRLPEIDVGQGDDRPH